MNRLASRNSRRSVLLLALGLCVAPLAALAQTAPATTPAAPSAAVPAPAKPAAGAVTVALETNQGPIVLELDPQAAPATVANFVQYVKDGFYDGTVFHRVIPTFMIQGGGYTQGLKLKNTRAPIAAESRNGLKNVRGAIAMARTSDPNSASSQFFINVVDNPNLDFPSFDGTGYTVFGHVVSGMEAVDKIRAIPTANRGMEFANLPTEAAVITHARIVK